MLPGRWTDEPVAVEPPQKPAKKHRVPQQSNYADPAVTQFCNEHFKELDDLQNVGQLIASLNEQQSVVIAQVI